MKRSAVVTAIALLPVAALAEVPAAVTTALSDAAADGVVVAGAVLVAIIGIYAFKLIRRAL